MTAFGHFEFRFQPVHMHFGIIEQLQCHDKIGNNRVSNLSENACACCLDTFLDAYLISKDLVDGKCLKKLCKISEYFEDLTELTKEVKLLNLP